MISQADTYNNAIRHIDLTMGIVTTIAGKAGVTGSSDATGTVAQFNNPMGIAMNSAETFALVVRDTGVIGC